LNSRHPPGVTYSPYTRKFYVGAIDGDDADFGKDQLYDPIAKYYPEKEKGNGQLEPLNYEMYRQAERDYRVGNIDSTSLSNITVIDLLREVIRREWRDYNAIQAVRRIPVPKLQLNVPIAEKYAASKKVPELMAADQKSNKFTQAQLRLFKNVVDIYESDESRLKATIEPLNFEIDQAAGALAEAANQQIVTEIETLTGAAKGDWGAIDATHGRNSRDPLEDIVVEADVIIGNHFRPNVVTMAPLVASNYLTNTFINGQLPPANQELFGVFELPKFPGIKAVVDNGFTSTVATLFDQRTMLFGEGPTVAEQFRDPHRGADGWVIRQWIHPLKTTNDAGRKLDVVTA